jgi:hypothetical protein
MWKNIPINKTGFFDFLNQTRNGKRNWNIIVNQVKNFTKNIDFVINEFNEVAEKSSELRM